MFDELPPTRLSDQKPLVSVPAGVKNFTVAVGVIGFPSKIKLGPDDIFHVLAGAFDWMLPWLAALYPTLVDWYDGVRRLVERTEINFDLMIISTKEPRSAD